MSCYLVRHFSCVALSCRVILMVRHFHVLHFQLTVIIRWPASSLIAYLFWFTSKLFSILLCWHLVICDSQLTLQLIYKNTHTYNVIDSFLRKQKFANLHTEVRESDKQLLLLCHRSDHHTLFPRHRCSSVQDDLRVSLDLQPVSLQTSFGLKCLVTNGYSSKDDECLRQHCIVPLSIRTILFYCGCSALS